jgi:hypothetical protein
MRSWLLAKPRPIAFHMKRDMVFESMVRDYHVSKSMWTAAIGKGFEALVKNRYRDIVSTCSSACDCMWQVKGNAC